MKKIFFIAYFFLGVSFVNAQQNSSLTPLLTTYYSIKDALVSGDAHAAAARAGEMLKVIEGVDMKTLSEKDHQTLMSLQNKLAYDARHISETTDISHQREHFTTFSANMILLAKGAHLSQQPIYEDYCPMKKAYWLSKDEAIRNPYFGNTMLTCGKVTTTLKP